MRVILIEPQGEGGICHYTYCLSAALQDQGQQVVLVTAHPYELAAANHAHEVVTPFGPGHARRSAQAILRRLRHGQQAISSASQPFPAANHQPEPRPAAGIAGRFSRWLERGEYRRGWKATLRLIQQRQIPVAHVQWLKHPAQDRAWLVALRKRGVRVVVTAHNVLPHDAPASIRTLWKRVYQEADALIVHYQSAVQEMVALGIASSRVTVIPHGHYLPIRRLAGNDAEPAQQAKAREILGLPGDGTVVLFFGLMRPYKGVEYLLDAFAQAHQALPSARLLLAGRAPDGFAPFAQRIARLGIGKAVVALPRYLPVEQMACCFIACDLVALPYIEASQSGVLQLAAAYGRPAIATRVGGLPDAVVDQETGILISPRDVEGLAAALRELLGDPARCAQMGRQAYIMAQTRFSWDTIAAATSTIYNG